MKIATSICENGFAKLAKTDAGYFGRGIYLTTSIDYAAKCYCDPTSQEKVLVLAWAALGNVYPVTEGPASKASYFGKPLNPVCC